MLSNVLNIFSESAYFGFLQFTYSDNANRNVDDAEEDGRLSSVSPSNLGAAVIKPKGNDVFNSSFGQNPSSE